MEEKKYRRLKVYGQSNGHDYSNVPTIILKGKWLDHAGFSINDIIDIEIDNESIRIRKKYRN